MIRLYRFRAWWKKKRLKEARRKKRKLNLPIIKSKAQSAKDFLRLVRLNSATIIILVVPLAGYLDLNNHQVVYSVEVRRRCRGWSFQSRLHNLLILQILDSQEVKLQVVDYLEHLLEHLRRGDHLQNLSLVDYSDLYHHQLADYLGNNQWIVVYLVLYKKS